MPTVANSIVPSLPLGELENNANDRTNKLTENGTEFPVIEDVIGNESPTTTLVQTPEGADDVDIVVSKVTGEVFTLADLAEQHGETSTGNLANKIIRQDGLWHNYRLIKADEVVVPDPEPDPDPDPEPDPEP